MKSKNPDFGGIYKAPCLCLSGTGILSALCLWSARTTEVIDQTKLIDTYNSDNMTDAEIAETWQDGF